MKDMDRHRLVTTALFILRRGDPLPADLVAHLIALGVDVAALERKHAR